MTAATVSAGDNQARHRGTIGSAIAHGDAAICASAPTGVNVSTRYRERLVWMLVGCGPEEAGK